MVQIFLVCEANVYRSLADRAAGDKQMEVVFVGHYDDERRSPSFTMFEQLRDRTGELTELRTATSPEGGNIDMAAAASPFIDALVRGFSEVEHTGCRGGIRQRKTGENGGIRLEL